MGKRAMEMIEAQIDALNAKVTALSARRCASGARREPSGTRHRRLRRRATSYRTRGATAIDTQCVMCNRQGYVAAHVPGRDTVWWCQLCAGTAIERLLSAAAEQTSTGAAADLVGIRAGLPLQRALRAAGVE
jgi:hypothetical protein